MLLCRGNLNNINHTMNNQTTFGASHSLKTKTVRFTYGTCKEAALQIPAEPASLFQVARLIRESYLAYIFSKPALMSDECLLASIGRSNFEAGALGGWESRLGAEAFASLKALVQDNVPMALAIVRHRNPDIEGKEAYLQAAKIEGLSHFDKVCLESIAEAKA
jgi:hypothetical protein